jgi:hypothetical protein
MSPTFAQRQKPAKKPNDLNLFNKNILAQAVLFIISSNTTKAKPEKAGQT